MRIQEIFDELGKDFLPLLMQTFDAIDDLVFVMSYNGSDYKYVYANRPAIETIQLPADYTERTLASMVSPEYYPYLEEKYDEARIQKKKVRFKAPMEHKGKESIGESVLTPIDSKAHDLHFIFAIVRDITEQEKTFKQLQTMQLEIDEEKRRLESLMHYNNEAIFQITDHGQIIKCNPEAHRFLQASQHQVMQSELQTWFKEPYFQTFLESNPSSQSGSMQNIWLTLKNEVDPQFLKVKFVPIFIRNSQQGWYVLIRDITAEYHLQNELQRMAFIDHLSGLPNRRAFDDRLDYHLNSMPSETSIVALFLIDGYKFKSINDLYGHDAGDAVIQETAKRLQHVIRDKDMVSRFGGDEFALIFPNLTTAAVIPELADRILQAFTEPFVYQGHAIDIRIAMGGSYFPGTALNKNQLLKEADQALYEIKESSGAGFKLYTS